MQKYLGQFIVDKNWPDWKDYILPRTISEEEKNDFEGKLESGIPLTKLDLCTYVFQTEFADKVLFVLQTLGHIKDIDDLINKTPNDRAKLIETIEMLMKKVWDSDRTDIKYKLQHDMISKEEHNEQVKRTKWNFTNMEYAAGEILYTICGLFGIIQEDLNNDQKCAPEDKGFYIYNSLSITNYLNDYFYNFKNMTPRAKGGRGTTNKRREVVKKIEEIIKNHKIKIPNRIKNPITEVISTIKGHYKDETGAPYPNSDKTLENLVYEYFVRPGN